MVITDKYYIDKFLNRGIIVDILPSINEFRQELLSGRRLRIYIGADPTSPSLHLSHAKNYMILEEFRKLGHEVIVLIGDFTARIGDPTDQEVVRKQLSHGDVSKNVKTWMKQIQPLMDFDAKENPPRILYNNDWLSKLSFEDVINLSSNITVQRMLERDMFEVRLKNNKPLFMHEFMYPLMQGYDSVAMEVDVELCGRDQIFNALVGRTLLKRIKSKDKFVVAVNLMENPVTGELMSKSRGTGVFLDSVPFDLYGQIMSQPDEMIEVLLINNTRIPLDEIEKIKNMENPRDAKMIAAFEITKILHGEANAKKAQNTFIKLVQKKETVDNLPEVSVGKNIDTILNISRKCLDKSYSNSDIRRLINQSAIKFDGQVCNDMYMTISIPEEGAVLKIGKKKWFKITQ